MPGDACHTSCMVIVLACQGCQQKRLTYAERNQAHARGVKHRLLSEQGASLLPAEGSCRMQGTAASAPWPGMSDEKACMSNAGCPRA
jgi:hypothetical protein